MSQEDITLIYKGRFDCLIISDHLVDNKISEEIFGLIM